MLLIIKMIIKSAVIMTLSMLLKYLKILLISLAMFLISLSLSLSLLLLPRYTPLRQDKWI
jgi:hypothetical protein